MNQVAINKVNIVKLLQHNLQYNLTVIARKRY